MPTVLILMSGGVDSSVAAALLQQQGYQVIGVTMRQVTSAGGIVATSGCCSYSDIRDAKRIAHTLGIDHYSIDIESTFRDRVIQPFINDYAEGRTPNPCVTCNREVRFETAFEMAEKVGAEWVATGHYVRLEHDPQSGHARLRRAVDPDKDQSYFLHGVPRRFLDRLLFPIGDYRKPEVRALAERFQLPVAGKPDSQEICFTLEGDVHDFFEARGLSRRGEIVDLEGNVLGEHRGIAHYTVGQRQGFGLTGGPWYALELQPEFNRVVVGRREDLCRRRVRAVRVNWLEEAQVGDRLAGMIRSQMKPRECEIVDLQDDGVEVHFDEPLFGIAPGQSLVLYRDDLVVGGGVIIRESGRIA